MRKIVVVEFLTVDGVMQAPGDADEDRSGGFEYGGWATPYVDSVWMEAAGESMAASDAFLFGRRTYEIMSRYWSHQPDDDPSAAALNGRTKYVVSTTLDSLQWRNSTLVPGELPSAVERIKAEPGMGITVLGSGQLARALMEHGLVDEWQLSVFPLVLGTGKRLFEDGGPMAALELVDSVTTTTGGVIHTYRPRKG